MVATNLQAKKFNSLLQQFTSDYPDIKFVAYEETYWDPNQKTIFYKHPSDDFPMKLVWSMLHEIGHAEHQHTAYNFDLQLLLMEKEAWTTAKKLGTKYHLAIDNEYIEDCMDSYRDWLHKRSTCPSCKQTGLQSDELLYQCLNCHQEWKVSISRFCRSYRLTK